MLKTFRLDFGNLEDHTHTQDTVQNIRGMNCRWPAKRAVDPYDDHPSEYEFGDENRYTNYNVLLHGNRAVPYTSLDTSGQIFDIASLGRLPFV